MSEGGRKDIKKRIEKVKKNQTIKENKNKQKSNSQNKAKQDIEIEKYEGERKLKNGDKRWSNSNNIPIEADMEVTNSNLENFPRLFPSNPLEIKLDERTKIFEIKQKNLYG